MFLRKPQDPDRAPVALAMGLLAITLLGLAGCGLSTSNPAVVAGTSTTGTQIHGHVGSAQPSVSGSLIQLYAASTQGTAGTATALLSAPVQANNSGDFTINSGYVCPASGSELYLVATGGNPGLSAGTNNDALALITILGPCSGLSATATYPIDEVTTVGSVWPLSHYIASATQVGAGASDASFTAALSEVSQLVNLAAGIAPGTGVPSGYAVQTAKLNTLADDLHACVVSSGGSAGDGSACGQLLSFATAPGSDAPTTTLEAALNVAKTNQLSVDGLFQFVPLNAPFQPVLPGAPTDWNLNLVSIPAAPTFAPSTGTYSAGQSIALSSTTGAIIHYTTDGSAPMATSPTYTTPLSLAASETVNAMAVTEDIGSSVSSAAFSVSAPGSNPLTLSITPAAATLSASQSQPFVPVVTGVSSSTVTWTISPAIGAINAAGLYTAPATITGLQTITITATATSGATTSTATATVSLTPAGAGNTIYYVDNVSGNDSNNGTSAATPLATIAKINSLNLLPGQTVAFKSGDVWHEMLTVAESGSSGNPIIYTSYGSGAQPVIDASDTVTGWTQASGLPSYVWAHPQSANPQLPNFAGQAGTPVANSGAINAPNQFSWNGTTLYVYAGSDPTTVVEVAARTSALTSAGASYINVSNLELRGGTNAAYCGVANPCANWLFESNTFDSVGTAGLRWQMNNGVSGGGLTVTNNVFRDTGGSGVSLANGGPAMQDVISNNTLTDLCKIFISGSSENAYCDAIKIFSQTASDGGGKITNNTISQVALATGVAYGGGIHADTVANWDVEHNTISATNYPGIELEKGSGSVARYNLLINTGQYQYTGGLFIRAGEGLSVSNMMAEYNTVVGGYWPCALGITQDSGYVTATNVTISNNICVNSSSGPQFWLDAGFVNTGNTFSSNGFGIVGAGFVNAGSISYGSYQLLPSPITGSISGDPQFVNPNQGNYRLQPSSPDVAIGAFPQP